MMNERWKKSSHSNGTGGDCVEARGDMAVSRVLVRDTRNRELGHLDVPAGEWASLLGLLRG